MSDLAFATAAPSASRAWRWRLGLWVAQCVLAALFGLAGAMKTTMAPASLAGMGLAYALDIPHGLLLFIGFSELAGALGVILPAAIRVLPFLTPLAALGFALIQALAIGFHFMRGELGEVLPLNLALLALSAFVAWGRTFKAPIVAR